MLTSAQLIPEFIQALQEEIDILKRGKGNSSVKVFNGQLYSKYAGFFIYLFHLENFLAVVDDTPAEIEIGEVRYQCQIISVQGLEVQIALEKDFEEGIAEARIYTNSWFLLELLCKKYEDVLLRDEKFRVSEKLFAGVSDVVSQKEAPHYALSKMPLNDSQKRAVYASFTKSLAIIWGPPGTGKTKTIARAVEAHLNAGRRVLLVSHANIAVDEALEDIAEQLEPTSFYQEGKLIRLGIAHKKTLEEKYPLVILENVTAMLGEHLVIEKNEFIRERERIGNFLESYQSLATMQSLVDGLPKDIEELGRSLSDLKRKLSFAKIDVVLLEKQQAKNKERLELSLQSGIIKRFFYGLDPQRIRREIDQLTITLDAKNRSLSVLQNTFDEVKISLQKKKDKLEKVKAVFLKQLAGLGINQERLYAEKKEKEQRLDAVNSRINEIEQALEEMQKKALGEARLIATTLTKTYTSKQFPDRPFDVLIIDEVSMAPLPHIFWAASKVTTFITLAGDFQQLSPISVSETAASKKWLKQSIFDLLGIKTIEDASMDERVSLLDTQYRMAPLIAEVPNRLFYDGLLKNGHDTHALLLEESVGGKNHLVLINTSPFNPWASRLSTGGRFNIYSALISTSLARKVTAQTNGERVGIITPYRAQARLINKIAKDWGILDRIRVNTVHSFQGGEEIAIIFDCVEGPGVGRWSMLDQNAYEDACRILNVAMTRAKCKVFLVAHKNYLFSALKGEAIILSVIQQYCLKGCERSSENLADNYITADFEKYADAVLGAGSAFDPSQSSLYTEKNFWPAFLSDIRSTEKNLVIMSPFISLGRAGKLMDFFRALLGRGVSMRIYTRPPSKQGSSLSEHAESVISQLESIGARVFQINRMHQKVAVIDKQIAWEGSLNILSHKDGKEQMRRIEGENTVKEIIRNLDLDREAEGMVAGKLCPECLKEGINSKMVVKQGRYGGFWGCERFPDCRYTESITRRRR